MMNESRDPVLESLFSAANRDLEGESITASVMAGTRRRVLRRVLLAFAAALLALILTWYLFALPLLDFAVLVSQFLTDPLVDLGEGWLALASLPINNLAGIAVLGTKLALMAWKKLTGTSLLR